MINIAFGLDDNFARHCAAAVASVLCNHKVLSGRDRLHIYFFGNLSEENRNNLLKLKKIQDFEHTFIELDHSEFEGLPLSRGRTFAIYNVLMIPVLLAGKEKKIIFLDCDLIVNRDIAELWNIDIGDSLLAAVSDNYRKKEGFFNSGVMVLNIAGLLEFGYYGKWKEYVKYNIDKMVLHDQDILNPVLRFNTLFLPVNWNVHYGIFLTLYGKYDKKNIAQALSFCYIVHFSTRIKPWHPLLVHPMSDLYFKYLLMTPWGGLMENFSKFLKIRNFLGMFFKYWFVHPACFIKPKFWRSIRKRGWLITLY